MSFWISAWVFAFAFVACLAALFGGETWRENLPMVGLMVVVMAVAGYLMRAAW